MKTKRILAGACIALAVCLSLAFFLGILATHPKLAVGSVTPYAGQVNPVFGNSQLTLSQAGTGTTTLNLSGTASTSIPCLGMKLALATTGAANVLMGSTSSSCTFPVYATPTSGTNGVQSFDLPQVTNVNQVWLSLVNSTTSTYTANVNAVYQQ